ncbi:MAG: PKD domain-containing protein [Solirubrobacterales bacterium]|nr:PKD domain-containing protein [Solirubrobacterales bacterium]
MTVRQRRLLMMLVLAGTLGVSAIAASSASAIIKVLPNGQTVSYMPLQTQQARKALARLRPFDVTLNNMDYNGGPIMPSNTDYMLMWSPGGLGAYPQGFTYGIARYFSDLQHDSGGNQNVDSVDPQYNDVTGAVAKYDVHFGGVLVDTDPYPPTQCPVGGTGPTGVVTNCLTDPQIQTEIANFVTSHHLPADLSHEYYLLTPPHVESCFTANPNDNPAYGGCSAGEPPTIAAYCAYHQNTATPTMVLYAEMPFDATNPDCQDGHNPNNLISDGEINGGLAHEHNESVTDPLPNDAWTNGAGPSQGQEVGDECEFGQMGTPLGTAPDGSPYNQVINGHEYWYQEMWSNYTHSCVQRVTLPRPLPIARATATAGPGTNMTFDASRSFVPGGAFEYSWQMNAVLNAPTVQTATPTFSYAFPAPGAYSTGVTVFRADGLSSGTGGIVFTGQNGFQPAFTVSRDRGDWGWGGDRTVHFSALTTVSGQPVINYMWEFGDGTTGNGPDPTHTYRHPGFYRVTAVLFSGVGSAYPGEGAGPVYAQWIQVGGRDRDR